MERAVVGFHQDAHGDWVAELACGHQRHVRHRPPFQERPWVLEEEGRRARIGTALDCGICEQLLQPRPSAEQGGEGPCLAHAVCPDCGAVPDGGPHAPGCSQARP